MKIWKLPSALLALAVAVGCARAGTIVQTGDELRLAISDRSFVLNSIRFGGPAVPTSVSFQFAAEPLAGATAFSAELESLDGAVVEAFGGELRFESGTFQGSLYSGAASVLSGGMRLPETLSQQLFAGYSAVLVLRNDGPTVELSLGSYSLPQELNVSLSASNFSAGATRIGFALQQSVPEPASGVECLASGALLLAFRRGLKRICRSRIE